MEEKCGQSDREYLSVVSLGASLTEYCSRAIWIIIIKYISLSSLGILPKIIYLR